METTILIRKKDRSDYVINGACEYYGISRDDLCKPVHNNPRLADFKKLLVHVLYDIADLRFKEIAEDLGYKLSSVPTMQQMRQDVVERMSGFAPDAPLKKEYNSLLKYLNL